jgi:UDP-N-acetylmuramate--alanine ligase
VIAVAPTVQSAADVPSAANLGQVHFIGIGGAGMSGIARILLARGAAVSGSDARESAATTALRALGARVEIGHRPENLGSADTVVVSTAIRPTNRELAAAIDRGLLVLPRAAALAAVMVGRRGVAIAGTHGKTTTTSMLTVALQHAGLDPSFAIGGNLNETGANAHDGTGSIFVAEADESDGSFLLLSPQIAVVTNVEPDHLDHYGTVEAVEVAFEAFADRVPADGRLIVCADDVGARRLAERAARRGVPVWTYGVAPDADVRVVDLDTSTGHVRFRVAAPDGSEGSIGLQLPGRHNALNATAAYAAGLALDVRSDLLIEGLGQFTGTRRRFELKGTAGGVRVYDDYAHHPTELTAVLLAARDVVRGGRVIACFQPHLVSRTRLFAEQFGAALGLADEVVVMDVYAAREDPDPAVTGALVARHVPLPPERVWYEASWSDAPRRVATIARPGDIVITFGAGDVTLVGPEVLALLVERAVGGSDR